MRQAPTADIDALPGDEQMDALRTLRLRADLLRAARQDYEAALVDAKRTGLTNVALGRAAGVTEAAVRNWFRRRGGLEVFVR